MPVSSWVESVEFIDAAISGTNEVESIYLTKGQNYENCVPFYTVRSDGNYWDSNLTDCYFSGTTESGIINFEREDQRNNVVYVKCYVVEFNPEEVRVQQGSFNLDSTATHTVTLPTTLSGIDRTAMTFGWKTSENDRRADMAFVRGRILNTTSIDFYRQQVSYTCNGHWFLFEDLNNNFRVYHLGGTHNSNQTLYFDNNQTIDPLRTFMLGSWATDTDNSNYPTRYSTRMFFSSDGSVYSDKSDTNFSIYWQVQALEILDKTKVYVPFEHTIVEFGANDLSFDRVNNNTPFLCNTETSSVIMAAMQGLSCGVNNDYMMNKLLTTAELTASGTITYTRGTSGSYATYPSTTLAVDWAGIDVDTDYNSDLIPEGDDANQSFVKSVENFRLEFTDRFGARVLTKGQIVENCALFVSSRATSGATMMDQMANVRLVEPGIVYARRWGTSGTYYVDVSVVEFYPSQIRVQRFNINTQAVSTTNVTISSVDTTKAFILHRCGAIAGENYNRFNSARLKFTSSTNVEVYINSSGRVNDISGFVVEDLQNNFVVTHIDRDWGSGAQFFYNNTHHWGYHNSFNITSYATDNANEPDRGFIRAYFKDEYCPAFSYKVDSTYTIYQHVQMVKFVSNKYRVQHYSLNFNPTGTLNLSYDELFANHPNSLTVFNNVQQSTNRMDTGNATYIFEAFSTIRITDYESRIVEATKTGSTYNCYGSAVLIDWIGKHWQEDDGYSGIITKSLINSIQKRFIDNTDKWIVEPLKYGQDVNQCVPFLKHTCGTTNLPYLDTKTIFRYNNPDMFIIGMGDGSTYSRKCVLYIVEFNSDIKVQHSNASTTSTSIQVTIDEVNLDRAFLHFYSKSDHGGVYNRQMAVCGRFVNSTTIEFIRNSGEGSMVVSWYVVECPEEGENSHWRVFRDYRTNLGSASTVYLYSPYIPQFDRSIYFNSWTTDNANEPDRGLYRIFKGHAEAVQMDKSDAYYSMHNSNVEIVEFNKEWYNKGLMTSSDFVSMGNIDYVEQSLLIPPERKFYIPNSMIINANDSTGWTRVDTDDTNAYRESMIYYEFVDDGNNYSDTIGAYKKNHAYYTHDYYFAIQWPRFNKYYFEGTTKEEGKVVYRELHAYRTSTGELVDITTSVSGTGYFYLETPYEDEHHVLCFDDDGGLSYNHLVYGKILPTVISGCFAHQMGLTASGIDIGIPQWYLLGE